MVFVCCVQISVQTMPGVFFLCWVMCFCLSGDECTPIVVYSGRNGVSEWMIGSVQKQALRAAGVRCGITRQRIGQAR